MMEALLGRRLRYFEQMFTVSTDWQPPRGILRLSTLEMKGGSGTSGTRIQKENIEFVASTYTRTGALTRKDARDYSAEILRGALEGYEFDPKNPDKLSQADGNGYLNFRRKVDVSTGITEFSPQSIAISGPIVITHTVGEETARYDDRNFNWPEDDVAPDGSTERWGIEVNTHRPYTTQGDDTTAFGQSAAGGSGGAGATETFTDVPVSRGTTYPITVGSGGVVTIGYYAYAKGGS